MQTIGANLLTVEPGHVVIELPYDIKLTQQHNFLHGGVVAIVLDSACGYAAYSLMPAKAEVLSIEFKVNLLAPARGERFTAVGTVIKAGRTITVCNGDLIAHADGKQKTVAHMIATMMTVNGRDDVAPIA